MIIHIDMDAFYASVEQRDNPRLAGKPVAVGGSPDGRGVVAAASYEARRFGVHSAMPARQAKKLCPQLTFIRPRIDFYREVSLQIRKIFAEVTDIVEPLSLDEAYLDVSQTRLKADSARSLAVYLRSRIKGQTGLTASAGVAPNKFLAKVASDFDKPDGLVVITDKDIDSFVYALKVEKLWGVGPATAKKLKHYGILTTKDIRSRGKVTLLRQFGSRAEGLWEMAHGRDARKVHKSRTRKSRGAERTFFKDLDEVAQMKAALDELVDRVMAGALESPARTVTLKVRFSNFKTLTRSETASRRGKLTKACIVATCARLLKDALAESSLGVRLLGVSLSGFPSRKEESSSKSEQFSLW